VSAGRVVLLLTLPLLAACGEELRVRPIADVTRPELIELQNPDPEVSVFGLTVVGRGAIDGSAEIHLLLDGEPYRTERLDGRVRFRWGGDWYADTARIRYRPGVVHGGRLVLRYRFEPLAGSWLMKQMPARGGLTSDRN
jgi:hypothetical protein